VVRGARLTANSGGPAPPLKGTPVVAAAPIPREEQRSPPLLAVSAFEDNVQLLMRQPVCFINSAPASRRSPNHPLQWPDRNQLERSDNTALAAAAVPATACLIACAQEGHERIPSPPD